MYIPTGFLWICVQKLYSGLKSFGGCVVLSGDPKTTAITSKSSFQCFEAFFMLSYEMQEINIFIRSFPQSLV